MGKENQSIKLKIEIATEALWMCFCVLVFLIWLSQLQRCTGCWSEEAVPEQLIWETFDRAHLTEVDDYLFAFRNGLEHNLSRIDKETLTPLVQSPFSGHRIYPLVKYPLDRTRTLTLYIHPKDQNTELHAEVLDGRKSVFTQRIQEIRYGAYLKYLLEDNLLSINTLDNGPFQITTFHVNTDKLNTLEVMHLYD